MRRGARFHLCNALKNGAACTDPVRSLFARSDPTRADPVCSPDVLLRPLLSSRIDLWTEWMRVQRRTAHGAAVGAISSLESRYPPPRSSPYPPLFSLSLFVTRIGFFVQSSKKQRGEEQWEEKEEGASTSWNNMGLAERRPTSLGKHNSEVCASTRRRDQLVAHARKHRELTLTRAASLARSTLCPS